MDLVECYDSHILPFNEKAPANAGADNLGETRGPNGITSLLYYIFQGVVFLPVSVYLFA